VRISQHDTHAHVPEVIEGVLAILQKVLDQHQITVVMHLDDDLPVASIGQNVLRQVLLGVLGYLVEQGDQTHIHMAAHTDDTTMRVELVAHAVSQFPDEETVQTQLAYLGDMLQLGDARIAPYAPAADTVGYALELPINYMWTVLAVDDNDDTLALFRRCLVPNRYRVVTTNSAHTVLHMAREMQPDVIILDLMMPEHDGWDVLQQLVNQPATENIPIMICSVIKQKELALTLGAAAYLTKPFTEKTLLTALETLLGERNQ
jgi:CheY-like chemotaxis protein